MKNLGGKMLKANSIWIFSKVSILLLLIGLSLTVGCSNNTRGMESYWTPESIEVDGQLDDWADKPKTYFKDEEVSVGLLNNAENLYILFSFRNDMWARLIRMNGVTIWFDKKGEKNKDFGIRYKGGPDLAEMREGRGVPMENLPQEQRERFKEMQGQESQMTIIDKGKHTITTPRGSYGVAVSSSISHGVYTYEFSIPTKEREEKYYSINTGPGQTISVGFEWGLSKGELQGMREEMGGERERGDMGGGPMGGGPMGGGMSPPSGERMPGGGGGMKPPSGGRQLPEKKEIWVKVLLASSPEE